MGCSVNCQYNVSGSRCTHPEVRPIFFKKVCVEYYSFERCKYKKLHLRPPTALVMATNRSVKFKEF